MNHQGTGMLGRIAQYAVAVLGILFFVLILSDKPIGIDGGLWLTYAAFGVCALLALVFGLKGLNRKALLGIVTFAVLAVLSWVLASDAVMPGWNVDASTSKLVGAGITLFYFGLFGAVGAILFGEVSRMLK
jgi:hypothetical protein